MLIFQTDSWFDDPFDSEDIGFFSVGNIDLDTSWVPPGDVHSKCLLLPETLARSGDPYDLDKNYINPIPGHVRDVMKSSDFSDPIEKMKAIREEYESDLCYPGGRRLDATWTAISLLRPGSDY